MHDLERGGSRSIFGGRHYQYQWSIAASMDQAPASSFGHGHGKCPRYAHQAPPDPQQQGIQRKYTKKRGPSMSEPPASRPLTVSIHERKVRHLAAGTQSYTENPSFVTQPSLERSSHPKSHRHTPLRSLGLLEKKPQRRRSNLLLKALSFNTHSISAVSLRRTACLSP